MKKFRAILPGLIILLALLFMVGALTALAASASAASPASSSPRATNTVIMTGTPTITPTSTVTPTCGGASPTWTEMPTVPAPGRFSAAGVVGSDGKFWLVGGSDENNNPIANNDLFDPNTNFWDSYAPLPAPRSQVSIGRLGNLIHVAGGLVDPTTITASHDAYDVTTNTWTHIDDAPYAFTGAMGVGFSGNNSFYVFGGQTSPFTTTDQILIYNGGTGNWTYGAPMPDVRSNGAATEWNGKYLRIWRRGQQSRPRKYALGIRPLQQHMDRPDAGTDRPFRAWNVGPKRQVVYYRRVVRPQ